MNFTAIFEPAEEGGYLGDREFPPRQESGAFGLDQVMKSLAKNTGSN